MTNRASPKKFHIVKKEPIRFAGNMMFKLEFESIFFLLSTNNIQYSMFKFGFLLYLLYLIK
jgi:hypothetical protein